jgi:hypothetical protein
MSKHKHGPAEFPSSKEREARAVQVSPDWQLRSLAPILSQEALFNLRSAGNSERQLDTVTHDRRIYGISDV